MKRFKLAWRNGLIGLNAQPVLNIRPTLTNFPQPLSPPLCVLAGELGILSKAPRFVGRSKSSRKSRLCSQAPESTHVDMVPGTREGYEDAIGLNTPVARKITGPSQGFPFPWNPEAADTFQKTEGVCLQKSFLLLWHLETPACCKSCLSPKHIYRN